MDDLRGQITNLAMEIFRFGKRATTGRAGCRPGDVTGAGGARPSGEIARVGRDDGDAPASTDLVCHVVRDAARDAGVGRLGDMYDL